VRSGFLDASTRTASASRRPDTGAGQIAQGSRNSFLQTGKIAETMGE
jgi:hypothetical protein